MLRHIDLSSLSVTEQHLASETRAAEAQSSLNLEKGHGREPLFEDVNLARTIGWFTRVFPVCLSLSDSSPEETLKAVKDLCGRL